MIAKVAKKAKSRPKFKSLCTAKELKQFEKVASRPSHPGEIYALACLQGKIPCGEYALRAMKRHFLDLIKSEKKAYPYRFDHERAEHTLKFFSFMRHSRAEWAGQPLKLDPWQQFIIWCVFGWVGKKTGHRRFRTAYIEIPRKNGKTTMAAGVAAYLADADGEMGAEVFCVGADESQSLRCFNEIKFSVRKSPELAKRFRPFKDIITIDDTNSFIRPVAHNPDAIHGQNPSGAIIDETHKHKNDEVFDAMDGGRGARREPLLWCISTAGNRQEGIGYELNARARTCLDAVGTKWDPDERFFTIIYSADQGDDSFDELTWRKANPGFGISVKPEYLEEQMRTAKQNARKKRRFEQDHLNIWSQEYSKWLDVKLWDACAGKVPLKRFAREQIPLYIGGDLAARQDMCAIVALWRYEKHFYFKPWFWVTRESLEIQRPIRTQLMQWAEEGLIHVEDSRIIDQTLIWKRVNWLAKHFNLQAVALDPTNAAWMMKKLDRQGITVVEYTQKPSFFAQPCKLLEDTLAEEGLSHGGNPVLRWQAANVVVKTMDSGYVHVVKKAAREQTAGQKIDGIIAMLQAMGIWQRINGEDDDMVYTYESGSAKL